jgi:hypothetical protein
VIESPEDFDKADNDCNNNIQLEGNFARNVISSSSKNNSPSTPLVSSSLSSTPNQDKFGKKSSDPSEESRKFKTTVVFLNSYLDHLVKQDTPFSNKEQNRLTLEVNFKKYIY